MLTEWHSSQGFRLLLNQLKEGLLYGAMIEAPVDDKELSTSGWYASKDAGYYLQPAESGQTEWSKHSRTSKNSGNKSTICFEKQRK